MKRWKYGAAAGVIAFLNIFFLNATPAEVYQAILKISGSEVTKFYNELVKATPDVHKAVVYQLSYSTPPGLSGPLKTADGVGRYDSATNTMSIYLNPAYDKDPIGAGFVIQHEFLHLVVDHDVDHSLSGTFGKLGTNGEVKFSESFDHVPAYQVNLVQMPNITQEYVNSGQQGKALLFSGLFPSLVEKYNNIMKLQNAATGTLGNDLTSSVVTNLKAQTPASTKDSQGRPIVKVSTNGVTIEALQTPNKNGLYEVLIKSKDSDGNFYFIKILSKDPLSSSNLSNVVDRFVTKIADSKTTMATGLTPIDISDVQSRMTDILNPQLNKTSPTSSGTFFSPIGLGKSSFEKIKLDGYLVAQVNSSSSGGSEDAVQSQTKKATICLVSSDGTSQCTSQEYKPSPTSPSSLSQGGDVFDQTNVLIDSGQDYFVPSDYPDYDIYPEED